MAESEQVNLNAAEGFKEVVLQLDLSDRPTNRSASQAERLQHIQQQKEWYEELSTPALESIRKLGCVVLAHSWITAEIIIAVPEEGFDEQMEELVTAPSVVDYYCPQPLERHDGMNDGSDSQQ